MFATCAVQLQLYAQSPATQVILVPRLSPHKNVHCKMDESLINLYHLSRTVTRNSQLSFTSASLSFPAASLSTDVTDIKYVVNFDFPNNAEDYVHRIGRTARAENTGTAYTFFTSGDADHARDLIRVLKEAKQDVNPQLLEMQANARGLARIKRSEMV